MGGLTFRLKNNVVGYFKNISTIYCILILFSLFNLSLSLYEDQIGKFDWKQTYVGKLKFTHFDTVSAAKKIIVATEENVIAALNLKSGQILWRHVLEGASQGNIQMLHVSDEVVTVSGNNPSLIRGWDSATGYLLWEWSLWLQSPPAGTRWWVEGELLHHLLPVAGSHLELTTYSLKTGQNRGATSKLPAPWISHRCVLSAPYYTCVSADNAKLISMDVTSNAIQLFAKSIASILPNTNINYVDMKSLPGNLPGIIMNGRVVLLKPGNFHVTNVQLKDESIPVDVMKYQENYLLLESHYSNESLHVTASNLESGTSVPDLCNTIALPGANNPRIESSVCAKTARNNMACRLLVTGEDSAVYLLQNPGKVVWSREEALSRIVGVEMLDLPVSELDAVIETEFDDKEGDILGMLVRRLKSQASQLKTLLHGLVAKWAEGGMSGEEDETDILVRDEFGLHKIIIAATQVGKVFAIDSLSGNIIWKRHIPFLSPFSSNSPNNDNFVLLYVQRTTRHLPFNAQCTIIGRHKLTGEGMLFTFNPITGAALDLGIANLGYRIKQTAFLNQWNSEFLKGIVILDENDSVNVYPPSCTEQLNSIYMFVADANTATVQGYAIKRDGKNMQASKTWLLKLGGSSMSGHRITNVASKNSLERVHSQGKVMSDRSVLYKYINPNLVAFTTEGPDPVHKNILNLFLIDVVSGSIIMEQTHRRARGPVRIVHSENWLVYSYYSDKSRRPEIATVELYEGPQRLGEGAFSSLRGTPFPPEAARQAYVLPAPAPPTTLATTITDRGITAKDVLVSLGTGAIVELPWALLDPRRPVMPGANALREEGLMQYVPELPLPAEAVLNYNQSLEGLRHIHTSPSGLESTCLVFAYGLDVFFTRVAPSKTFDLLKEDFDYSLIVIVLISLIVASDAAKKFASRKVLRQAWK